MRLGRAVAAAEYAPVDVGQVRDRQRRRSARAGDPDDHQVAAPGQRLERGLDHRRRANALEGPVDPAGRVARSDLLANGLGGVALGEHEVGRAEAEGLFALGRERIDRDDPGSARDAQTLDHVEPDPADAEDGGGLARSDLGSA